GRADLPAAMCAQLPPELGPQHASAAQFARRIGIEDAERTREVTEAAVAAGVSDLDALRALTADPERRFEAMRRDGISGECVYPSAGLYVWDIADPAAREAGRAILHD